MDDSNEAPDPTHQTLKAAIRYGIAAWVLLLLVAMFLAG
jgi:hypothetical protein